MAGSARGPKLTYDGQRQILDRLAHYVNILAMTGASYWLALSRTRKAATGA
jgi:hypothetical protein